MTHRILACGSRAWTDRSAISDALEPYISATPFYADEPTVMHGDAGGADRIAGELALELGFWVEAHPADWRGKGKRAGILRNLAMLDEKPDVVLAFQVGNSPGTQHTITEARKRGIPVRVWKPCLDCGWPTEPYDNEHGEFVCDNCVARAFAEHG